MWIPYPFWLKYVCRDLLHFTWCSIHLIGFAFSTMDQAEPKPIQATPKFKAKAMPTAEPKAIQATPKFKVKAMPTKAAAKSIVMPKASSADPKPSKAASSADPKPSSRRGATSKAVPSSLGKPATTSKAGPSPVIKPWLDATSNAAPSSSGQHAQSIADAQSSAGAYITVHVAASEVIDARDASDDDGGHARNNTGASWEIVEELAENVEHVYPSDWTDYDNELGEGEPKPKVVMTS